MTQGLGKKFCKECLGEKEWSSEKGHDKWISKHTHIHPTWGGGLDEKPQVKSKRTWVGGMGSPREDLVALDLVYHKIFRVFSYIEDDWVSVEGFLKMVMENGGGGRLWGRDS